ncbi:MAG: carboxy terminal-processing peptidase, partial [Chlamydiae bacterium]|nr:carboxy terminal-processing peptidase [Chlamydiota bacterium]
MKPGILGFFLLFIHLAECKMPPLENSDVKAKIEEVFQAHACYKAFTPDLAKRALQNYLDELDPTKTYFLNPEISLWTNPSNEILGQIVQEFKTNDYSLFQDIHTVFLRAIERRNALEKESEILPLPKGVSGEEFQDLSWAANVEELKNRLLRIKALQLDVAAKMGEENKELLFQRLQKRRHLRELELSGQNAEERSKVILTYVLKAAMASLDAHTNYLTPTEANQF